MLAVFAQTLDSEKRRWLEWPNGVKFVCFGPVHSALPWYIESNAHIYYLCGYLPLFDYTRYHQNILVVLVNQSVDILIMSHFDFFITLRLYRGQGIDIKNLSSRSVLTVTNMTEDRYGNYTCVAINRLGTANASVPLLRK